MNNLNKTGNKCYLCGQENCVHINKHKCGYCWDVIDGDHFDFCPTKQDSNVTGKLKSEIQPSKGIFDIFRSFWK